jgi:hypothetical protein
MIGKARPGGFWLSVSQEGAVLAHHYSKFGASTSELNGLVDAERHEAGFHRGSKSLAYVDLIEC